MIVTTATRTNEMTTTIEAPNQDLVDAVRDIGPLLRAGAEEADREGRLPEASLDAYRKAGLCRISLPRSLGGLEADPVTLLRVQEELGRHDSAAAWLMMITAASAWWTSRLPVETVREIYGPGPDQIISVSFGVPVEATAVDGGFILSGQRALASHVSDASWIWLTALNMQDGQPEMAGEAPVVRACYFPAADATIVHTWDSLGMRGTDSNDVLVENLFVPQERTFRIGIDHTPSPLFDGPLYRLPVMPFSAATFMGTPLGLAREAIDELVALASGKTPFSSNAMLRERGVVQSKVGRAEGLLRSARAYLYDRIADAWEHTLAGKEYSLEQKTESLLASVQVVDACAQAVDLMYSAAGSTGIYKRHRLERLFRDAQVVRQHGFVSDTRYETVGQVAMGLAPELGFVAL